MTGCSTDSASNSLRVRKSCDASLYVFEISEDAFLEGPRDDCDDERYSEFDKEWVAVDIVTVEEPEELLFIMTSLLDSGNCIAEQS